MSERFGEAATHLAGLASRALGWTPRTFWAATPADLANALADPCVPASGVTRADIDRLMEQDRHG